MNKLFTKIGVAMVGLAMAVGVGVAVGNKPSVEKVEAAAGSTPSGTWRAIGSPSDINVNYDYLIGYEYSGTVYYGKGTTSNNGLQTAVLGSSKTVTFEEHKTAGVVDGYYIKVSGSEYLNNASSTNVSKGSKNSIWIINSTDLCIENTSNSNRFLGAVESGATKNLKAYASGNKGSYLNAHVYGQVHSVTYNANGGTGTMTDSNSPYLKGKTVTAKTNTFTKSNYTFAGWNTKANGSGSSYDEGDTFTIEADTTLYAQWEISGTSYSVTGVLTECSLDNTANVAEGATYTGAITPTAHHHLPDTIKVEMGEIELDIEKNEYTYSISTGAISVPNVVGDLTITVACENDPQYSITYFKGEHGTGSNYVVSNLYAGNYNLATFAATGLTANSGYKFDHWDIGGSAYAPGAEVVVSDNVSVTAVYSALANKISIAPSNFVNTGYADNNGPHTIGDYEITTNAVMRGTGDHSEEMQFQKTNGAMYNTTIGFSHGIKMIKMVGSGSITVTFDTTLKTVAGSVESKAAVTNLGTNVTYYIPDTTDDCVYFHIQKDSTGTAYFTSIEIYSSESAAEEFSKMYLAAYTCNNAGTTAPTATTGYTVANISTLYSRLDDATKALLINAADNHTASYGTDKVKEFGQRYYLTVYNHGSDYDFMGRIAAGKITPKASAAMIGFDSGEQSDITFVIITISVVSLIAVGGFFFLRKKKEQ